MTKPLRLVGDISGTLPWQEGQWAGLDWAAVMHRGFRRARQEDRLVVVPLVLSPVPLLLLAVADGLGGSADGAAAAEIAVQGLADRFLEALAEQPTPPDTPPDTRSSHTALVLAFGRLDAAIRAAAADQEPGATTLVAVLATARELVHAGAGDSRFYHLPAQGRAYRTRDHSMARIYVDGGRIANEEEAPAQLRNTLFSTLGGPDPTLVIEPNWGGKEADGTDQASPALRGIAAGDLLMLCSDGLWGEVEPARFDAILAEEAGAPLRQIGERLVAAALAAGGRDNIAVILARPAPMGSPP
ncbi:PP2C family protein-serine/threonine phosphatase [Falsiroseomonas ponticola]|uniref:PP2C family protein-serine/threonine phosphatase n=1 Tax=Falsiroseomonas ponticola TaxID=2786951 RepID=UPI001931206D|nr:protein phosphatase 2C domain-containing protein [Roseomonas ponticola]